MPRRSPIVHVHVLVLVLVLVATSCKHHAPKPVIHAFPRAAAAAHVTPSAGCGAKTDPPRGTTLRTPSKRAVHVWAPKGYDGTRPYPVVLAYHGWESSGAAFEKWFELEAYVDDEAIVVYPDAARGRWDLAGASDIAFFDDTLALLDRELCVDRARVFAFGFSMGGKLAHELGCERGDRLKAISVGDGSLPPTLGRATGGACAKVPVLVTHRTRDDDELFAWGKDAEASWAKREGCAEGTDVVDAEHACVAHRGCRAPVLFCEDTFYDPSWRPSWNHTVREEYRALTWAWFRSL